MIKARRTNPIMQFKAQFVAILAIAGLGAIALTFGQSIWPNAARFIEAASLVAVILAILEMNRMRQVAESVSSQNAQMRDVAESTQRQHASMQEIADYAQLQNEMMREIAGSMSTRYVGKFPDHLSEVISLINTAKKSLRILCDVPGYCHFSIPNEFLKYKAAIDNRAATGVKVEAAFLDKTHARHANKEQLGTWNRVRTSDTYKRYISLFRIPEDEQPKTAEAFLDHLGENYDTHLESFRMRPFEVHMVRRSNLPMYFWIVDDRLAVFSFPSLSVQPPEVAFKTSDRDLLNIMERIWQEATQDPDAQPVQPVDHDEPTAKIPAPKKRRGNPDSTKKGARRDADTTS